MKSPAYKIFPLGDSALTIEFRGKVSEAKNERVIALSETITNNPFDGFVECVPAYKSVSIFYDPAAFSLFADRSQSVFANVKRLVKSFVETNSLRKTKKNTAIEIPVDFSIKSGPDLKFVADHNGLKPSDVIEIFCSQTYRVFLLGFLPGFPYMGSIDKRIEAPRLETPRLKVPKGSIGIAGLQTGIYPLESPGGWRLIGRTKTEIFKPKDDPPSLLAPGDLVNFVEI